VDFFACALAAFFGAADILFTLFARTGASSRGPARGPELDFNRANRVPIASIERLP
jgi:hypothetical protein